MFSACSALRVRLTLAAFVTLVAFATGFTADAGAWKVPTPNLAFSTITSPSGTPFSATWDYTSGNGDSSITVSGSIPDLSWNTGSKTTIACFRGSNDSLPAILKTGVEISETAPHTFSTTISAKTLADETGDNDWLNKPKICALRAVPETSGGDIDEFNPTHLTGPDMAVSTVRHSSGAYPSDYFAMAALEKGGAAMRPGGNVVSGGVSTYVRAPFEDGGSLNRTFHGARRLTGALLDGTTSANVAWFSSKVIESLRSVSGYVPTTWSRDFSDPAAQTVSETEALMRCTSGQEIESNNLSACTHFSDTGVRMRRVYNVGSQGRSIAVVDQFTALTGTHSLSFEYWDSVTFDTADSVVYTPPGAGTPITPPDSPATPVSSIPEVGTFLIRSSTFPDNSPDSARAALTYTPAPKKAFLYQSGILSQFDAVAVSASPVTIRATLSQSLSQAEVDALASAAEKAFAPPGEAPKTPTPSFIPGRAKATRDKKSRRVVITTGRLLVCPADGPACEATAKLTATFKVKKKKKTVTFATGRIAGAAGSTTAIVLKLNKKHDALFSAKRKLKFTLVLRAGSATDRSTVTLKAPPRIKRKQ